MSLAARSGPYGRLSWPSSRERRASCRLSRIASMSSGMKPSTPLRSRGRAVRLHGDGDGCGLVIRRPPIRHGMRAEVSQVVSAVQVNWPQWNPESGFSDS